MIAKIWLADDDRARLQHYVEWLLKADDRSAVRIVTRETAVGFYGITPSGVMTFIALPLIRLEAESEPVDAVSSTRLLLGAIRVSDGISVSDELAVSPALSALPPAQTWLPAERGLVGDLVTTIDRAVAQHVPSDTAAWGGFTLDALRVAKGLGLLVHPAAQVVAATNAGWKRLMTPAGQIFLPPPRTGRGVLHLVRT